MQAISPRRRRLALGGAVAGVAAVAALAWVALRPDPLAITVTDIKPVTTGPGTEFLPSISPDGNDVAYEDSTGMVVLRPIESIAGGERIRVDDPSLRTGLFPTWSPDGRTVRFYACPQCGWREVSRMGGGLRALMLPQGVPDTLPGIIWSPDDARVAYFVGDTLFVASRGEEPRVLFAVPPELVRPNQRHSIAWSPDGRRIAFVNGFSRTNWRNDPIPSSIWVVEVESGEAWEAVGGSAANFSPTWFDERRLLFVSTAEGPRAAFVVDVGRPGKPGRPRLVPGISDPFDLSYSVGSGRLVFSRYRPEMTLRAYPLDSPTPIPITDGAVLTPGSHQVSMMDLSPDGAWMAYEGNLYGNSDIYKLDLAGGEPLRLTYSAGLDAEPAWSPDGREIAFTGAPESPGVGQFEVFLMSSDGGTATQLTHATVPGTLNESPLWFPDGNRLTFVSTTSVPRTRRTMVMERAGPGAAWSEPREFHRQVTYMGAWGPDGSSFFYARDVELVNGERVFRVDNERLIQITLEGDTLWSRDIEATTPLLRWGLNMVIRASPDGRSLYSRALAKDRSVGIWAFPDMGRGQPRQVVRFVPGYGSNYIEVGTDRLYLAVAREESDIWVATLKR